MNCKIIFLLFVSIVFLNAHGHKNFGQKLFGKVKTEIKQIIKSMGELVQHSEHNAHNLRDDSKNKNARFLIGGSYCFNIILIFFLFMVNFENWKV